MSLEVDDTQSRFNQINLSCTGSHRIANLDFYCQILWLLYRNKDSNITQKSKRNSFCGILCHCDMIKKIQEEPALTVLNYHLTKVLVPIPMYWICLAWNKWSKLSFYFGSLVSFLYELAICPIDQNSIYFRNLSILRRQVAGTATVSRQAVTAVTQFVDSSIGTLITCEGRYSGLLDFMLVNKLRQDNFWQRDLAGVTGQRCTISVFCTRFYLLCRFTKII